MGTVKNIYKEHTEQVVICDNLYLQIITNCTTFYACTAVPF